MNIQEGKARGTAVTKPAEVSTPIGNVSELIAYVEKNCDTGRYLFRGQPRDEPLLPKIARNNPTWDVLKLEKHLLEDFRRGSVPYLAVRPEDEWDWLAVAQHYGLMTRLLDWTDNPLAALWFAVQGRSKGQLGVVWVFDVPLEDVVGSGAKPGPFRGPRTQAFRPRHLTRTIVAQGGWFTVHKYLEEQSKFLPLEQISRLKPRLFKLRVSSDFRKLRTQLHLCGVNEATMFPELGRLCRHLNSLRLALAKASSRQQ